MRGKRRRWLRWALLGLAVCVIGVLGTGWMMFQHIPSWYQPMVIAPTDEASVDRVKADLAGTENIITESLLHEDKPFEHRFTQDQINAWLAARESIWPKSRNWLPQGMSNPFVDIDEGRIRIAATIDYNGVRTVISALLEVSADVNGVFVRLAGVETGALSVPQSWVLEQLATLDGNTWPDGRRSRHQIGGPSLPALSELFEGAVFPNAWIWWNSRSPFRVIGIDSEAQVLVVTIEPLAPVEAASRPDPERNRP